MAKLDEVILEISSVCNLLCPVCPVGLSRPKRFKSFMTLDLIKKILKDNPGLKAIYLDGWGEPLLHPQLEDILKTINDSLPSCNIYITTVADMLDKKMTDILLKYKIYEIQFSLDPQSVYKSNRGANYSDIKKNIDAFMDANKKAGNKIKTCIKSIVNAQSEPFTDGLVDEWKSTADKSELIPAIKYDTVSTRSVKCKELDSKRLVVLSDSRVTCCRSDFRGGLLVGFAHIQKLEDIYDDANPLMKRRRDKHTAGQYPVFCKKCTEYSTAKASKRFT